MKIIDRYILGEVLLTSTFAVAVLSVVLVLGNIFKKLLDLLVNHDVPLEFIFRFIAYVLPFSLTFTIPWGFLTAVLLVFGRMSAENELIALRTSGLSIPRLTLPVLLLSFVFTGICLWINIDVAPRAQIEMKNTLFHIATSNPIALFGGDRIIDQFPNRKIYVGGKNGTRLENIHVFELSKDNDAMRVIHAKEGELKTDRKEKRILMRLYNARFEQRDDRDPDDLRKIRQGITGRETTIAIDLKELYEKNKKRRGLSSLTLEELNAALKDEKEIRGKDKGLAVRTERNKRFSFSLACVAFALIGIPLGITAQRRETSIGFAVSLIIAFVYFLLIIIADTFRNDPKLHPDWLMWAPNILFMTLGLFLFIRLSRR